MIVGNLKVFSWFWCHDDDCVHPITQEIFKAVTGVEQFKCDNMIFFEKCLSTLFKIPSGLAALFGGKFFMMFINSPEVNWLKCI